VDQGAAVRRGGRWGAAHDTYVDLVAAGVGTIEACQRVGVSRSTGWRWRHPEAALCHQQRQRAAEIARAGDPARPVTVEELPPRASRGRFLDLLERIVIADLWRHGSQDGASIREIAGVLERAPSTISREIDRNSYTHPSRCGARRYGPYAADRAAAARRSRPKTTRLAGDEALRAYIQHWITKRWSPEQIAARLPRVFPDQPARHVCHETIYQALYLQGRGELRREVAGWLRRGRARRRARRDPETRRTRDRFVEPMIMISERPAEVADRAVPGHWEGDLIIGADGGSAMITLVERSTRYVLLGALPHGRDAAAVRDQLIALITTLPAHLTRSLTWDQGSEMARHGEFRSATGIEVYFCDPASPWLRGSNENTNGLLRQYFPKGSNLSVHSAEHLAAVAAELNGRPRKTLNWDTPAERLATLLHQTNKQQCCDHP
jgi:transposase, IS30 family